MQHSSELAQKKAQETFAEMKKSITETLDKRLQLLETQIVQLTSEARCPLVKVEAVIKKHNQVADDLLDEGVYEFNFSSDVVIGIMRMHAV